MKCNPKSIPEEKVPADKLQLANIYYLFLNGEFFAGGMGGEKPATYDGSAIYCGLPARRKVFSARMENFGGRSTRFGREVIAAYGEFLGFLSNALIFMSIGIYLSRQNFAGTLVPIIAAILLVTIGRACAVYPCCAVFGRSVLRVKGRHQHVLFWGGLRGALALALAIGLPSSLPNKEVIVSVSFAVVAFSVFVQGLTMTPLLRRIGEIPSKGI